MVMVRLQTICSSQLSLATPSVSAIAGAFRIDTITLICDEPNQ